MATRTAAKKPSRKDASASTAAKTAARPTASVPAPYRKFLTKIQKRDGRIAPFDFGKIVTAIEKAMKETGEGGPEDALLVAQKVAGETARIAKTYKNFMPTVEGLQDEVERQLILSDYVNTAKSYILYRAEHAKMREELGEVPAHVQKLAEESASYFKNNPLGEFVYLRTYSRWIESEQRRETWVETVQRYMDFMRENLGKKLTEAEYAEIQQGILKQEAMPSMRLMQFSGDAARRCNVCAYNCSFIAPTKLRDFAEIMYISMSGTGVGYSAESRFVEQLPQIALQTGEKPLEHTIEDSTTGWCDALTAGLEAWYAGRDIAFDFSLIRPAGARLKTKGGKASGPEPLRNLLQFTKAKVLARQGRRLRTIDVHDIICKIGENVVAGGVRRSALISLSDLDDEAIRHAKDGQFYLSEPQRSLANNSAVYEQKPTVEEFMDEWFALVKGKTGERGIFNRGGLVNALPKRRIEFFEKKGYVVNGRVVGPIGTNPCGEIILQSKQFCNLTEVVARAGDTEKDLLRKARLATIIGTYQASLTKFEYLSKDWTENCKEEALLGTSITGQWDCPTVQKPEMLRKMRAEAIKVNKQYAKRFGINESTCVTTTKPSGNLSQTVNCASGMHPRYAPYYIRRVRIASTDSLYKMLRDQGVPFQPEVGQTEANATTWVAEFPVKAPAGTKVFANSLSAIEQLEYWKNVKLNYTEHNPSQTIHVSSNEWLLVANWVYENWDIVGGLSFLPRDDHVYRLAPYEATDKETYERMCKTFEGIDYSRIILYEKRDETDVKKELACASGVCEIL
ncbi:MAG TPA: ATP cone domain-containing protein [Candidatus Paceibacterota bacterium]|nr:ATP cone domain-containing protein [Candidatus Paceibacterota bacterium]